MKYDSSTLRWVVDKVKSLEAVSGVASVNPATGTGNAITDLIKEGSGLTPNKGLTFSLSGHTHPFSSITDIPTTIEGYGIMDAYTKSQTDALLALKLDVATFNDLFEKVNVGTESSPIYAIKAKYDFYSIGEVSAFGAGSGSSSGGGLIQTVYDYSSLGSSFNNATITDTFNAYTINQLHTRLSQVESVAAFDFTISGTGNAITGVTKNGNVLEFTKGLTFSLEDDGSGGSSGGGLIQTVHDYSSLGGTFNNDTLTDTFNAYTINQLHVRLLQVEAGTGAGTVSSTERTNWNLAYTNNHTHANKSLLDAFSQSDNDVLNHLSIVDGKLKVDIDFYSTGEVSAFGAGSGTGGSGLIQTVYGLSGLGGDYSDATLTNTFNAYTINSLHNRINSLEAGSALNFTNVGSGNVVTSVTKSGTSVSVVKGLTAVLEGDTRLTNNRTNPYSLTFLGYSTATYDGSVAVTVALPTKVSQLTNDSGYLTSIDADLVAIAALTGTSGLLRKTAANTWSLDTNAYLTAITKAQVEAVLTGDIATSTHSQYLTGNQTITVSGDATGSGATSIALTLANSGVVAGTYNDSATQVSPFTVDAKGRITGIGTAVTITPAWSSITSKPTTLSGYGITDGVVNTDSRLSDARIASDVYAWAKASVKPSYTYSEVGAAATSHTHTFAEIGSKPTTLSGYSITSTDVTSQLLTGYASGSNSALVSTDSILTAFGKIQAMINARPGTVTSIAMSVPTGLSITSSPITSSGTLALSLASGYSIPTTAKQVQWDTAYTNNHTHSNKALLDSFNQSDNDVLNLFSVINGNLVSSTNIVATGEITAYSASDIRLKKNINSINNGLEIINKLNPVIYNWNDKAKELNSNKTDDIDSGLIAQELENILPEHIHLMGNGYKSIDYIKLIPYLISAIKELNNKLNNK